jgi:hypothetical protein
MFVELIPDSEYGGFTARIQVDWKLAELVRG